MAVRVRRVVMPMPTLPGTDSAGTNSDSQASTTNTVLGTGQILCPLLDFGPCLEALIAIIYNCVIQYLGM